MEATDLIQAILDIEEENKKLKEENSKFYIYSLDQFDERGDEDSSIAYKDFLKEKEVLKYLGIGRDTLINMRIEGLPRYRLHDRAFYYSKEDIKNFLLERIEWWFLEEAKEVKQWKG